MILIQEEPVGTYCYLISTNLYIDFYNKKTKLRRWENVMNPALMDAIRNKAALPPPAPPPGKELPPGWREAIDKNTGRTYYYNKELGQTRWDFPT